MIEHLYRLPEDRRPQADLDDITEIINTPRYQGLIDSVIEFEDAQPLPEILKLVKSEPNIPPTSDGEDD